MFKVIMVSGDGLRDERVYGGFEVLRSFRKLPSETTSQPVINFGRRVLDEIEKAFDVTKEIVDFEMQSDELRGRGPILRIKKQVIGPHSSPICGVRSK